MVRSACCERMGLKKGAWSPEEDQILVNFIKQHGHGNWRALPKQAGLLRCGKSCRLRWTNYLRPDIKRGNFTKHEEDLIFSLHHLLGNRWSAIAARLPGRTDNEIKNVWHTHLKKKLFAKNIGPASPHPESSSSDVSSSLTDDHKKVDPPSIVKKEDLDYSSSDYFPHIDDSFWSVAEYASASTSPNLKTEERNDMDAAGAGGMDFWYDLFIRAGDLPDLPEF